MTTKERIVEEALTLFSTKGFKGTSVKNIAEAVGIKDASLYKHFKSKQEILDTIVATMKLHIGEMSQHMGLPNDEDMKKTSLVYASYNEDMLVELSKNIFLFYLKDSFISRFWRMGNIEQYQNAAIYKMFRQLFLEDSITYQTMLFAQMIKDGAFTGKDASVMAMNFYTPIFFLLSKYSNDVEHEEEAVMILEKQVREFCRIYCK